MKFLSKAGFIIDTDDAEKIECYKAQGLKEYIQEPQPEQKNVEVVNEYTVKKKLVKSKTK